MSEWNNNIFVMCHWEIHNIANELCIVLLLLSYTHTTNLLDNALQKNTLLGSKTASCVESVSVTERKVIRKRVR